jgi:ribosome-binding protein aMBF1 (putative translation factor)
MPMSVQFIRAPNGEEMAVLPRAEYEALLAGKHQDGDPEDAADIAMYDARKAEMDGSLLPSEMSAYLLRGDGRLKAARKWRGLSQVELAERVGIGQGYFSEIESGRKAGASETIDAIARALDVPREWIS